MYFKDRVDAGRQLAKLLEKYQGKDCVIFALPRGGAVIGAEIAGKLHAPLDLIITRKIGHPKQSEYAIGAVGENGNTVFNEEEAKKISQEYLLQEAQKQKEEAQRRRKVYINGRSPVSAEGKIAIITDDGIATGLTVKAALSELRTRWSPEKIIIAVSVIPEDIALEFEELGIEVIALIRTDAFQGSIGAYYQNFDPVEDEEVIKILGETARL